MGAGHTETGRSTTKQSKPCRAREREKKSAHHAIICLRFQVFSNMFVNAELDACMHDPHASFPLTRANHATRLNSMACTTPSSQPLVRAFFEILWPGLATAHLSDEHTEPGAALDRKCYVASDQLPVTEVLSRAMYTLRRS
jgi:hypothetical protein